MEFPLNNLPPEMIDLIADKLSVMDCLHAQKAFARDPKKAVANIRNGLTVNLAKQSALYLLMDTDEYDVKYQYNYQLEGELPNAFLPTLEGLPIASEAFKMITLPELERISISRLKETFPNVVELKVVQRQYSPELLTQLAKVVAAFSCQLTALQLFIFSDRVNLTSWQDVDLSCLLSHLNDCHFDCLRHFTLLFEDMTYFSSSCLNVKSLRLLSSATLEECYLRLPTELIEHQLGLLGANQGLQQWGLIAYKWYIYIGHLDEEMLISPSLAAKAVHLLFPLGYQSRKDAVSSVGWQMDLNRLEQFNSLRRMIIRLNTDGNYLTLMKKLNRLGSLTHLKICLRYVPVSVLTFCQPLSQLAPCSPSVTHLKIMVESITGFPEGEAEGGRLEFSHLIFSHLSILRHFPNLQQLEVVFPRDYSCSLCEVNPGDEGRECMEKAMQPFRALDLLTLTYSKLQ